MKYIVLSIVLAAFNFTSVAAYACSCKKIEGVCPPYCSSAPTESKEKLDSAQKERPLLEDKTEDNAPLTE